jgi:medium-chain acyl-[acyl-carrier-protein] hydrolase
MVRSPVTPLARSGPGPGTRWVVDAGGDPTLPPLLIFPHAGAGPGVYRDLARRLRGSFRPLVVHLPGRESRVDEPPYRNALGLVRTISATVLPLLSPGFILYGHSMGALLAFELARQLRRGYGMVPDHLVVSGYPAPRVTPRSQRHLLPDAELWGAICGLLGTPREVAAHPAMMAFLLPALRADLETCETYRYPAEPRLDCPISSFGGRFDEVSPARDMAGWADETRAGHRHQTLPGGHFFNLEGADRFVSRLLLALGESGGSELAAGTRAPLDSASRAARNVRSASLSASSSAAR